MSVEGSPVSWLETAVRRGDLAGALAEVPRAAAALSLAYALAIVVADGRAR